MTSLFTRTAAKADGAAGAAVVDPRDTAKYLLRVTAGPSYDAATHGQVNVNGEAYHIDNELCTVAVTVRIRDYHGLPRSSPPSDEYFSHPRHKDDRYSISFAIRPKRDVPGSEMVMGFDFDRPIRDRLPPLFRPALKFVTSVIDPGIYCDAYADKPYLYGPGLSSFYILNIGDMMEGESQQRQADDASRRSSRVVAEGAGVEGQKIRDSLGMPENSEKRRKWFLKQKNLDAFTFEAGREYEADFFNPYLDFANFAVRLPGFSIGVARYIDDKTHELRYVLKNRRTDEVYFVVVFTLLFGEGLKAALREDRRDDATLAADKIDDGDAEQARDSPSSSDDLPISEEQHDQYLRPPSSSSGDGLVASLSKWLPRMLRSGGTVSGTTTPGSATPYDERSRSMDEEREEGMSDTKAEQHVEEMTDANVAETLRARHLSGA